MDIHEFARRMPKVELHVHLEGSIRPPTLLKLAAHNHVHLPVDDEAGLREFYRFRDFPHFIQTYLTITGCLQTPDDYRLIAYEFGADRARQNIRYSEVTFTICSHPQRTGLPWQAIVEALNQGRFQARQEFGVDWGWVFDINRGEPHTQAETLEIVQASHEMGAVALGIGGNEANWPPSLFTETFERARQAGVHRVPHAGEVAGPQSVWDALTLLHAERIGHGVRSIEDPSLVAELARRQIPLEICPTSNVVLGVYPDYASHPLRLLWDQGVYLTVNSDDPPMFSTDLNYEYEVLVDHFRFGEEELKQITLNALHASFLTEAEKSRMEEEFQKEYNPQNSVTQS